MNDANRYTGEEWAARLEGIDLEIARQAIICQVPLLAPGVAERVLHNDEQVCGAHHPHAFATLRGLLYLHFTESRHLQQALGVDQAREVAESIRQHLRQRSGDAASQVHPAAGREEASG